MLMLFTPPRTSDPGQSFDASCPKQGGPCDQSAVIPPVEADPRAALPRLILQVGCLVELLVVVNTERKPGSGRDCRTCSTDLGLEKPRRHAGEDDER